MGISPVEVTPAAHTLNADISIIARVNLPMQLLRTVWWIMIHHYHFSIVSFTVKVAIACLALDGISDSWNEMLLWRSKERLIVLRWPLLTGHLTYISNELKSPLKIVVSLGLSASSVCNLPIFSSSVKEVSTLFTFKGGKAISSSHLPVEVNVI